MLPLDLSTFIKLPFFIKIYVFSIFELPFYTGFTVYDCNPEGLHAREMYKFCTGFIFSTFPLVATVTLNCHVHLKQLLAHS